MKEKPASSSELLFKNRNKQTNLQANSTQKGDNKEEVPPGPVHKANGRTESFSLGSRTPDYRNIP